MTFSICDSFKFPPWFDGILDKSRLDNSENRWKNPEKKLTNEQQRNSVTPYKEILILSGPNGNNDIPENYFKCRLNIQIVMWLYEKFIFRKRKSIPVSWVCFLKLLSTTIIVSGGNLYALLWVYSHHDWILIVCALLLVAQNVLSHGLIKVVSQFGSFGTLLVIWCMFV